VATATLVWPPPDAGAVETWVDLGLTETFAEGAYTSHGPVDAATVEYAVGGLPAGVTYHYRVNARSAEGSDTVAQGSFVAGCDDAAEDDVGLDALIERLKAKL
jgi:hypothetical protein